MKLSSSKRMAVDHSQEMQDLQKSHRLEVLLEIHRAILATQDLQATTRSALRQIQPIFPQAVASSVVLLDLDSGAPQVTAFRMHDQDIDWEQIPDLSREDLAVDLQMLEYLKLKVVQESFVS